MTDGPAPERSRLPVWAVFGLVAATLLAQGGALKADWILDDTLAVRTNEGLDEGLAGAADLFADGRVPGEVEHGAWRPVTLVSFAFDAQVWGTEDPLGFHLTNLLLHVLCTVLLFLAFWRHVGSGLVAVGAAVCFAVHPMNTGTITALVGRADLLALALALVSLRAWDAYGGRDLAWLPVAAVTWFLALLAKEAALGLPLAFVVLDVARGGAGALRKRAIGYGALLATLILFLVIWPGAAGAAADVPAQSLDTRVLLGLAAVVRAAMRMLLPVGYRGDHTDEVSSGVDSFVVMLAAVALVLTAVALVFGKRTRSTLAVAWLVTIAIGVPAALVAPVGAALELRFAYVALAPLFVIAGLALEALGGVVSGGQAPSRAQLAGRIAWVAVVVSLAFMARDEAQAWEDDASVHARVLRERPNHAPALIRHGRTLRLKAERLRAEAERLPTQDAERRPNPAVVALNAEQLDAIERARGWLGRAVSTSEGAKSAAAWRELGLVLAQLRSPDLAGARRALQTARDVDPVLRSRDKDSGEINASEFTARELEEAARTYFALGQLEKMTGASGAAAEAFRMASKLAPDTVEYLIGAGTALCERRRWGEGLPLLERARRLSGSRSEKRALKEMIDLQGARAREMASELYRRGLQALEQDEDPRAATELFEAAVAADENLVQAWIQAGRLRGMWFGDYSRGHAHLSAAERIVRKSANPDPEVLRVIDSWRQKLHAQKREEDADIARDG